MNKFLLTLLFSLVLPCTVYSQVFDPLGPISLHNCIRFPDGRVEIGRITDSGYQILDFGSVFADKRKKLKKFNSRINKFKRSLKKEKRKAITGDKKQIRKWKKAIKRSKVEVKLLTSEIKALESCRANEPIPTLPPEVQVFTPKIQVFPMPFDRFYVGAFIVVDLKKKKLKRGLFTRTSTSWCLQISGDERNPPPYEYKTEFQEEDICKFIPSTVFCDDSQVIGKNQAAWAVTGVIGVSQNGLNDAIKDVAKTLSERSYFGRERKTRTCNTDVPTF